MAAMLRRHYGSLLITIFLPAALTLVIFLVIFLSKDDLELKKQPPALNLKFYDEKFRKQFGEAFWFGASPNNDKTVKIMKSLISKFNLKDSDVIMFEHIDKMKQHVTYANLAEKAEGRGFVKELIDNINNDLGNETIFVDQINLEKLEYVFRNDYLQLKTSSTKKVPILFAIDFDIQPNHVNYSVIFNDDAIYWYHFNIPDKQNTQFGHFFTSYYWSSQSYVLQMEIEKQIYEVVTQESAKDVSLHALPRTSDVALYNWQKMYVSVLATMSFSFVFVFSFLTKIRQNSYVLLKRLGVPDWDFWLFTYLIVFITLWLSLFLNFLVCYFCDFLPFAYYNFSVVVVLPFPISFCFSSFAIFLAMLIKNDKLQVIISTLTMLCFTMFPLLLAVFMSVMKSSWDPSFIIQWPTYIAAAVSPIFTAFTLVEQFAQIVPNQIKQSYIINKNYEKQQFNYIYKEQWQYHDYFQMMDPTLTFNIPSFSFYWISIILQTLFYFAFTLLISYLKNEQNQVGFRKKSGKRKLQEQSFSYNEEALLVVNSVSKSFKNKTVLSNVSFEIMKNKIYGIIGSSGSGKTTLLSIISGLIQENRNCNSFIVYDNKLISNPCYLGRRSTLSICPQDKSNIFDFLPVRDNVNICMELSGNEDFDFASEMISVLNLNTCQDKCFNQLSGGMQRRFALLMSLLQKPKLLLLDEITANVDPMLKRNIWEALKKFQEKNECAIILASHDSQEISNMADQVLFLQNGVIQSVSSVEEIIRKNVTTRIITKEQNETPIITILKQLQIDHIIQQKLKETVIQLKTNDSSKLSTLSKQLEDIKVEFRIQSYQVNEIIYDKIDEVIESNQHEVSQGQTHFLKNLVFQIQKQWYQSVNSYCALFIIAIIFCVICLFIGIAANGSVWSSNEKNYKKMLQLGRQQGLLGVIADLESIIKDDHDCDNLTAAFNYYINHIKNYHELRLSNQTYPRYYKLSGVRYFDHLNYPIPQKYYLSYGDLALYKSNNRTNQFNYFVRNQPLSTAIQLEQAEKQISLSGLNIWQSSFSVDNIRNLVYESDGYYKYFPLSVNPHEETYQQVIPFLDFNKTLDALNYYYSNQLHNLFSNNYSSLDRKQQISLLSFNPSAIIDSNQSVINLYLQLPNIVVERTYNNTILYMNESNIFGWELLHENTISLSQKYKADADEPYFVNMNNDVITKQYSMQIKQKVDDASFLWQAQYYPQPKYSTLQSMFNSTYQKIYFGDLIVRYFLPFSQTLLLVLCLKQIHEDLAVNYLTFLNGVSINPFTQQLYSFLCHTLVYIVKLYINNILYIIFMNSVSYNTWTFWVMPLLVGIQNIAFTYVLVFVLHDFSMECIYICISVVIIIVVSCIMQPPLYIQGILSLLLPGPYSYTINIQAANYKQTGPCYVGAIISLVVLLCFEGFQFYVMKHNLNKVRKQSKILKKAVESSSQISLAKTPSEVKLMARSSQFSLDETLLLQARDIKAYYKKNVVVLENFNIDIERNNTTCLVGVNGSGKSTFLKCLIGSEVHFTGDILMSAKIGIVPQDDTCIDLLTVRQNLLLMCNFSSQNVDDVIEQFNLRQEQNIKAKDLASGQRRRLTIAMAVVTNPQLLILDEVTVGLDYELKRAVWNVIMQLRNCAVMAITHDMHEIDSLADNCCILDQGAIIQQGKVSDIKNLGNCKYVIAIFGVAEIPEREGFKIEKKKGMLEVHVSNTVLASEVFGWLAGIQEQNPDMFWSSDTIQMESVFMNLLSHVRGANND